VGSDDIRLMIVDDDHSWRESVRSMFASHPRIRVTGIASTGAEAVKKAAHSAPDAVLIDHGLADMTGLEAADQIHKVSSGTQVFLYTDVPSLQLYKAATAIGVKEVFTKPFVLADVVPRIEEAVDRFREEYERRAKVLPAVEPGAGPMGVRGGPARVEVVPQGFKRTVIAVTSPKGGVGKTMLVANMSVVARTQAAMKNLRVAVVDFNEYEYLTTQMNLAPSDDPEEYLRGDAGMPRNVLAWRYVSDKPSPDELAEYMVRHPTGVWVLPGVPSPEQLYKLDEELIRKIVDDLRPNFDLVVIDTPPSIILPATNVAVELADYIFVVTIPEPQVVRGSHQLRRVLESMRVTAKCYRVDNRYNMPHGMSPREIDEYIPYPSAGEGIPDEPLVIKSIKIGEPLSLSNPEFASSIKKVLGTVFPVFIDHFAALRGERAAASAGGGFLSRLFGRRR